ncbi:MAG: PqqD family protein [Candidatus Electronema sp. V4]|uniref:PqqD family protein n=1 Tax=Candidatus Electronema sp. V4 TaxID=3454756 RepID=UPI0040555CBE
MSGIIINNNDLSLIDEKFLKNENVRCNAIDYDIHVLFNQDCLDKPATFILNEIGFFIWNSFDGKNTGRRIADKIKAIFNIEESMFIYDFNKFILDLRSNFLICKGESIGHENNFHLKTANYLPPLLRIIDMEPLLSIGNDSGNNMNCGLCGCGGCHSIKTAYSYY